jgi:hypothetical protein
MSQLKGKEDVKSKGGAWWPTVCLSMYSITENIYYSQLSSVAILQQSEPNCFTSYSTRKWLGSLSLCAIVLRSLSSSHVSASNGQISSQLFCVHCVLSHNFADRHLQQWLRVWRKITLHNSDSRFQTDDHLPDQWLTDLYGISISGKRQAVSYGISVAMSGAKGSQREEYPVKCTFYL